MLTAKQNLAGWQKQTSNRMAKSTAEDSAVTAGGYGYSQSSASVSELSLLLKILIMAALRVEPGSGHAAERSRLWLREKVVNCRSVRGFLLTTLMAHYLLANEH